MTESEWLILSLIGPTRKNIAPLACAVDLLAFILFVQNTPPDDVYISKHIYPDVARQLGKSLGATARSIERLANFCWAHGDPDVLLRVIGRPCSGLYTPKHILFFLAFYRHFGIAFYHFVNTLST
ncbi:MAG TPA: sporulation initiation factor Spo0A C-terminal domain-containing protein [Candidatus Butyricicoccus avicola]|nr:sporulation initiation factor Spo0A C-terminal domain-containing protein [Candidatus Butyricicoccus avicola]